jgi:anthranilate/para-aminobenzoate synthase component I
LKEQKNNLFLDSLQESEISFWVDSSGGPEKYSKNSFYGINPAYYIYGNLNEVNLVDCESGAITFDTVNCFDFLEEKLKEEKQNKDGIFIGYFSYDLSDFFFAYFDHCHSFENGNPFVETLCATSLLSNDSLQSNMTDIEYLKNVQKIKEEIKKGNVYQVNLTRKYIAELKELDELDLYLRLRQESPNPYGGYFKTPFLSILSSSPEEFIHVDKNRLIRTRPIKGTLQENEKNIDPKNQAENIMIVDLERNDLGKICEYGSVKAKNLLEIEKYKNLNHVVSTVEGKLKNDVNLRQIFEALFPGGSITGAPKIAAMKIINEIEPTKRGAYTGSFGYIKTTGEMKFNILIRTIFAEHRNGEEKNRPIVSFNVGGGIVADSDSEAELEETRLKASGIMKALGIEAC